METIEQLTRFFQQNGAEFLNKCCVINGSIWSLETINQMGLEEYASRSIYSLPAKFYKYFSDIGTIVNGETVNYSIQSLETNTVYLSSPSDFDDVYDSEISVSWKEFADFRIKTYALWSKCNISDNLSCEEIANSLIMLIYNTLTNGGDIEEIFDLQDYEEFTQLVIKNFILKMKLELFKTQEVATAFQNIILQEYDEFCRNNRNSFRVACFTTSPTMQVMWGKYANEHRGFCLEYTVNPEEEYTDVIHNIRPVMYCKVRHPVTQSLLDSCNHNLSLQALRDIYLNGVLRKSLDWAFQNEWRLLLPPDGKAQKGFNKQFFPITKVFLGNRMSANRRMEIIEICKRKSIPYVGMVRSQELYEMQECKHECETCEHLKVNGIC